MLKRARSSPLLAAQLDWPRRLNMALDAAKGGCQLAAATVGPDCDSMLLVPRLLHIAPQACTSLPLQPYTPGAFLS